MLRSLNIIIFFLSFSTWLKAQLNAYAISEIGDSLYTQNHYDLAQRNYIIALKIAEEQQVKSVIMTSERNIARCYYYLNDLDKAIQWLYRFYDSAEKYKADSLLPLACYHLGAMYIEKELKDSSLKYCNKAINLMIARKDYGGISRVYTVLAQLYISTTKDSFQIERMLSEARKYSKLSGDKAMMGFAQMKFFNYYFHIRKLYGRALLHIDSAEKYYMQTKEREAILNAFRAKTEVLVKMRDTSAYAYVNKWFLFKDSVLKAEKAQYVAKYEAIYETEKKEAKIRYQKELIEKEKKEKWLYLISSFLLLAMIVFTIVYLRLRHKHKLELMLKEQNEMVVREIFQAEQKERIRIARDLHDSIGQKLSVMKMLLPKSEESKELEKISSYLDETATEVRSISHNLIPEILNFGLIKALDDLVDKINVSTKINVDYRSEAGLKDLKLEKQTELSVFRIVQEILNNIIKHAQTSAILMEIKLKSEFIHIHIADNGTGFDVDSIDQSQGIGWKNIFARIKLLNGKIDIRSEKNKGSQFIINVPVK